MHSPQTRGAGPGRIRRRRRRAPARVAPTKLRRLALWAPLACGALIALPGCNIVGPAYVLIHGPEKVPALYDLDKERTAVIFVDDRGNYLPRRSLRITLATEAERLILKKNLVKDMISAQSAMAAAAAEKGGQLMSIADVGRSVSADQVIYVSIDEFALSPDGQAFVPSLSMRVKVIDANNDRRLWPEDRAGHPVSVRLRARGMMPDSTTERAKAEDELARAAGEALAHLFYKHEKPAGTRAPDTAS